MHLVVKLNFTYIASIWESEVRSAFSVLSLFSTIIPVSSNESMSTHNRSLSLISNNTILDDNSQMTDIKFSASIIIEYIRSLNDYNIPVQYFIYELLVNLLVRYNQFFQLQQLIQYQVLTDSLQLGKNRIYFQLIFFYKYLYESMEYIYYYYYYY